MLVFEWWSIVLTRYNFVIVALGLSSYIAILAFIYFALDGLLQKVGM